ncbi:hypothetical protein [Flavobacterium soyangense]|uniref:Uncharacterized protein n=1 Tax=Flavobacterium soyangense TaxID=2023265 RepID=A0A930XX85_9FLAO|nr:hypothetical protein [Flavobacterium soyangense]MBF2709982.1 hypothetical protein [Flavobacterium soyangense]
MKDIAIGVLFILFGIAVIWFVSKRPKNIGISSIVNFQGCTFGVVSVFLGLMIIFGGLHF